MIVIKKNRKKNNWEGLELNGKKMEIAEEYKYLGEVINNKGTDKTTIEKRVQAAKRGGSRNNGSCKNGRVSNKANRSDVKTHKAMFRKQTVIQQ